MSIDAAQDAQIVEPGKRGRLVKTALLALVLIATLLGLLAYCQSTADSRTLRQLILQSRDAYHEPWNTVEEAAIALADADTALTFVSERIATSVYEGRLQTPEAVLETRTANPADKAMLLQALLEAMDIPTTAIAAPLQGELRSRVLKEAIASAIAMPEPMVALMKRVGYDEDDLGPDQMGDAIEVALLFDDVEANVDAALDHAHTVLDLDGASSAQAVYLDWVWLSGADGVVYDPVLPDATRSDLARDYTEALRPTQIALTARDRFGRTQEVVRWSGDSYGKDVNLAFYPTINTLERLIGDPDLSDVSVWTPGIVVGNDLTTLAAVTNDGDVVPQSIVSTLSTDDSNTVDVSGFTAPEIASLSITGVDSSTFPRVLVGLSAAVQNLPNWHAAHFRVLVEGQAVPVRIEAPYTNSSDVIVVHDQSGSMREEDRFAMARTFNRSMVGGLSAKQKLAVIAHAGNIRVQRLFEPLVDVAAENQPELWDLSVGGETSFLDALDFALNAVEIELGPEPETRTSIVLVSDGASSLADLDVLKEQMAEQMARAQALNIAVYPVILSSAQTVDFAKLAQETGGQLIRIQDPARIVSAAQTLARRLSGNMAISFTAPHDPVPDAGSEHNFTLEVVGYDGIEPSRYTVPDDIVASDPALFVEISAGAHRTVRPVMALGDGYDVNAMTGGHALYVTPGTYPSDRMTAQWLNRWLFAHDAAVEDEEAMLAHLQDPAFSTDHATTMNGLANLMQVSLTERQALQFPMAALVHTVSKNPDGAAPGAAGEPFSLATILDVPAWSSFLSEAATREEATRVGFALNDAEARLLGDGTNLTQLFAQDTPSVQTDGETLLLASSENSSGTSGHYWVHEPETGSLFGYLENGIMAVKGSQDVAIAAYFKSINSAIDQYMSVAQPGVDALPTGAVLSGFIGFKKEEMKLWCYSTIMLNYVNESIEGQEDAILDKSAQAAEARAAKLCEIDGDPRDVGKRMFREALKEMGKAVIEKVKGKLPDGVKTAIAPPDLPGWLADKVGTDRLTKWIDDPTVQKYAEDVVGRGKSYLTERAREAGKAGYSGIADALQRHGVGGGTGVSGGVPTTTGFNVAIHKAISDL